MRRLLIALNVFVAACLVLTATGYGYVRWRFSQVERVDLGRVLRQRPEQERDHPLNVLVVGTDTRADTPGARTDTILVLRVEPKANRVAFLSVPRDLWAPIAGTTGKAKINAAFNGGGPARLIATIRQALGIEIDHYVAVDFSGFKSIVDVLGGVDLSFPAPARDTMSGLHVPRAGCVHLDGERALQLVRSRELEQRVGGVWHKDRRADLGRIERQQAFVRRLVDEVSRAARNPLTLNALLDKLVPKVTIDDGLDPGDIRGLASRFRTVPADEVELLSLPVTTGWAGRQSVVFLDEDAAAPVLARMTGRPGVAAAVPATTAASTPASAPSPTTTTTTTTARTVGAAC